MMQKAAFFDVDETLITVKSMFDFLQFHLEEEQTPDVGQTKRWTDLQQVIDTGMLPRAEINRGYYRIYRGLSAELLRDQGARWFAQRRREPGFIQPAVMKALVQHRHAGHVIVLVSGSFPACLEPLRTTLGAQHLLCSRPLVGTDGLLTGEIEEPMIGDAKAAAIRELASRHGLSLPYSSGYGDHASDLPLLLEVGYPAVVGSDPVLDQYAELNNWRRFETVVTT
jgi:HAD superfamily hydrolase (TIGR01490 family)